MGNRRGGITFLTINGQRYSCKGSVEYTLGVGKRETIVGVDSVHGFSENPQAATCKMSITDASDLDVRALQSIDDATVIVELANGKTVAFYEAWQTGENTITTDEGEIAVQFDAKRAEEIQ